MTKLLSVIDPRDRLAKARRTELMAYAASHGIKLDENMPADLMRSQLRERGLTRPDIPHRVLGAPKDGVGVSTPVQAKADNEISTEADLARQWQAEQAKAQQVQAEGKSLDDMTINELRAKGKELGIKFERRDTMPTMREKIQAKVNGQ